MDDDVFLTTEQVLEYLQVNLRTVYRLIKSGKLPAVRVGRQWRFRKSDVDRWLGVQTVIGASEPTPPTPPRAASGRDHPRVLVVDDEKSIRDLLQKALGLAEYEVHVAPDGPAGLQRLRQEPYDLLIADLKMPGMDGLTLIREARKLDEHMPVIIITGYSSEASAIEAVNLGVTGYLTKPFRIPQVLSAAAKALGE